MKPSPLVLLFLFAVTFAPARAEEAAEEKLTPEALVAQLGDPSYNRRERARLELVRREHAVQEALEEGLKSDDLEVRYHCEQLLVDINERAMKRRLETFVNDGSNVKDADFPGWPNLRTLVGDDKVTRELYVEMYKVEGETLKLLDSKADTLSAHIEARSRVLQRRMQQVAQGYLVSPLEKGNIAAMLLASCAGEARLSPTGNQMVYSLCHQQVFRDGMNHAETSVPLRKLLGQWVLSADDNFAYQGMMLLMQYNMSAEGLATADKVLAGKATAPHVKQYAILTIAKLGDEKHIDKLKTMLEDQGVCSQQQVNKVIYKTEIRDVALFAMVHLSKQDPKQFGFDRFSPNPTLVANVHTLGFESDEKRKAAFDAWNKFEGEKAKVAEKK